MPLPENHIRPAADGRSGAVPAEVVEREAAEQGKALDAHYAHLSVHGMLHLQGFDHGTTPTPKRWKPVGARSSPGLGYPDPYAGER